MSIDRKRLTEIFVGLGSVLKRPATLCLIGSTPSIYLGQKGRQTNDIDVWQAASDYDAGELEAACQAAGILFDPRGLLPPGQVYLQIVRSGTVPFPKTFDVEVVAKFGALTVAMASASAIVAAKLTRVHEEDHHKKDMEDISYLISHFGLDDGAIRAAIGSFRQPLDREVATENMILVHLLQR